MGGSRLCTNHNFQTILKPTTNKCALTKAEPSCSFVNSDPVGFAVFEKSQSEAMNASLDGSGCDKFSKSLFETFSWSSDVEVASV